MVIVGGSRGVHGQIIWIINAGEIKIDLGAEKYKVVDWIYCYSIYRFLHFVCEHRQIIFDHT